MKNTFSSEIGYRLIVDQHTPQEVTDEMSELLLSGQPIEIIVSNVRNLLTQCVKKRADILIEKLLKMLQEEDPCLHDITQLQEALQKGSWPVDVSHSIQNPSWKDPSIPHYRRDPNMLASKIEKDIEQIRTSPQAIFQAVCELAESLHSYSAKVTDQTFDLTVRCINLAVLFADKYDIDALAELIIAFDKIAPNLEDLFIHSSAYILYDELYKRAVDGIPNVKISKVLQAVALTAPDYIIPNNAENSIDLNYPHEIEESEAAKDLLNYCLEQLETCLHLFKSNPTQILECLCYLQAIGFKVDGTLAARLLPEDTYPLRQHDLLVSAWSHYIFDESLSEEQRENLYKMEKELQSRFDKNIRPYMKVSDSEKDAQRFLEVHFNHLPLSFNTWLYGFERDCLVKLPYGKYSYVDFEIDGYDFHRFKEKKDRIMDYISKKKGVKVVRIEKLPDWLTKRESIMQTHSTIARTLKKFRRHT